MSKLKIILLGLLLLFLVIQFVRPEPNIAMGPTRNRIETRFPVPADLHIILQRSCYDCHSNTTTYPWYAHVEPVGWWLTSHINEGKRELNFDEFVTYPPFRQFGKFEAIKRQVQSGDMPIPAYTLIHTKSILSPEQKSMIIGWATAMQDSLKAHYPPDSLARRPGRRPPD